MKTLRVCCIEGCGKGAKNNGMCWAHYARLRRYGDASYMRRGTPNLCPPVHCTVSGCDNAHLAKGLCRKHYTRLYRHGDVDKTIISSPGEAIEWLKSMVSFDGPDCLIWPFLPKNSQGYASARYDGRQQNASRIMCTLAHGDPPDDDMDSAHSCGKGHEGCVHPKHLRWATRTENHADKKLHGTHLYGEKIANSKLTEKEVREIKESTERVEDLAAKYGISRAHAYDIRAGKRWPHIK